MKFLPVFIVRTPAFSTNECIEENHFNEALYIASPTLYYENTKSQLKENKTKGEKLELSLLKYKLRSCHRSTPFGLFSAVTTGEWSENTSFIIQERLFTRRCSLDMNTFYQLTRKLIENKIILDNLNLFPNNSIYFIDNSIRYIEYYYTTSNKRIHKITKVENNEYLSAILDFAKTGKTILEISRFLCDSEITQEEAYDFIKELVASQILVTELEPKLTGDNPLNTLLRKTEEIKLKTDGDEYISKIHQILVNISSFINTIEKSTTPEFTPELNFIPAFSELKKILPDVTESNLFKIDMFRPENSLTLDKKIQDDLTECIQFLNKINPDFENQALREFKKQFTERFGEQAIQLSHALDTECGIKYPIKKTDGINELIDDLVLAEENEPPSLKLTDLIINLNKLREECLLNGKSLINLDESSYKFNNHSTDKLPPTLSVSFRVLNNNGKIYLINAGGSSAINLLGRFGYGNKNIMQAIRDITALESDMLEGKELAEIIHLPESRVANVLVRPQARNYEIPYLGLSSLPDEKQLPLSDLYISVRDNRVILKSKKLNKEIIPRLGNAHNFMNDSLPVYHFLCDLQNQQHKKFHLNFNWAGLQNLYDYLPRVEYKSIVLSPSKWIIRKEKLDMIKEQGDLLQNLKEFIRKNKIPGHFIISESDNELYINLDTDWGYKLFLDVIKKARFEVVLEEYLFEKENALIKDTSGNGYNNEIIAIVATETKSYEYQSPVIKEPTSVKRRFFPGEEWLYFKIYCGVNTADRILIEEIRAFTNDLLSRLIIKEWFFIRFYDPEYHIRLRFRLADYSQFNSIFQNLQAFLSAKFNNQLIFKIQADTYDRELERYGFQTIEDAELFFYRDSECCLNAIEIFKNSANETYRWLFAFLSTNSILNNLIDSDAEKVLLMEALSNGFFEEHGGGKSLRMQLDRKFREYRPIISRFIKEEEEEAVCLLKKLIAERDSLLSGHYNKIKKLYLSGSMEIPLSSYISSLIHMNLNRIFSSRQRTNELVIYNLVHKYLVSSLAQNKQK